MNQTYRTWDEKLQSKYPFFDISFAEKIFEIIDEIDEPVSYDDAMVELQDSFICDAVKNSFKSDIFPGLIKILVGEGILYNSKKGGFGRVEFKRDDFKIAEDDIDHEFVILLSGLIEKLISIYCHKLSVTMLAQVPALEYLGSFEKRCAIIRYALKNNKIYGFTVKETDLSNNKVVVK